jgi:hypothetical protein
MPAENVALGSQKKQKEAKEVMLVITVSLAIGIALVAVHKSLAAKMLASNVALGSHAHQLPLQRLVRPKDLLIGHARLVMDWFLVVRRLALSVAQEDLEQQLRKRIQCQQRAKREIGLAQTAATLCSQVKANASNVVRASQPLEGPNPPCFQYHLEEDLVIGLAPNVMIMFSLVISPAESAVHRSLSAPRHAVEK